MKMPVYPNPDHYLWEDLKLEMGYSLFERFELWVRENVPEEHRLRDGVQVRYVNTFLKEER